MQEIIINYIRHEGKLCMSRLYIPNSIALRNFDSVFKKNNFTFTNGEVEISFHRKYVAMHPIGLAFYASIGDYFQLNNIRTMEQNNDRQ